MTPASPGDAPLHVDARELKPGDVVEIHAIGDQAPSIGHWTVLPDDPHHGKGLQTTPKGHVVEVDVIFYRMQQEIEIPEPVAKQFGMLNPKGIRQEWKHFILGHHVRLIDRGHNT